MLKEYLEGIKDITLESNELTHRAFLQILLKGLKDDFNKEFKIEP
ncbi:DNA methyltransferase [Helicobacter pylori]|nr:DNA methyltransferase [Helicobacter pylori]MBH0235385.1 DNA methyltransferase [Helicobacter pylori]MBH0251661.1 DNA methyltransferase [Helicobacter pylori]MBH0270841.1 DNA methyltransferase [Helicobacter pylori]NHB17756.1 DNA methyltransferase [Helicobacter pylori]QEF45175.1 DNA methyltransferase [Helicobacter pylori]